MTHRSPAIVLATGIGRNSYDENTIPFWQKTHQHQQPSHHQGTGQNEETTSQRISPNDNIPVLPEMAILRGAICSGVHITDNGNAPLFSSHIVMMPTVMLSGYKTRGAVTC